VLGLDGTALADTFAAVDTLRDGLTVATLARAGRPSSVLVGAGQGAFTGDLSEGALGGLAPVGFFEVGFEGGVFVG
jgi:hypothetical protein